MDFEVTGSLVLYALLFVIIFTVAIIFIVRSVYNKRANSDLTSKHAGTTFTSPLEGRNKYPEVDTFSLSGTFLNYGLLAAIVLMILAFSWTQYEKVIDVSNLLGTLDEEIEMETPRTAEPPPPPPPPPPPKIQEVPNDVSVEETVVFKDQSIEEKTEILAPEPVKEKAPPPPPPPPPPKQDEEEIFKVVEDQPSFPGCENISDKSEKKRCADEKMLQFIYGNIKYPAIARENGVEGMVVVKFVVEKDGSITAAEVVRDIGAGCGQEAMRVVNMMPKWEPGKQRGRAVRVQFNLPVKFKLE